MSGLRPFLDCLIPFSIKLRTVELCRGAVSGHNRETGAKSGVSGRLV